MLFEANTNQYRKNATYNKLRYTHQYQTTHDSDSLKNICKQIKSLFIKCSTLTYCLLSAASSHILIIISMFEINYTNIGLI